MNYSIIECAFCLFTFALFVNSAILITAGASLYDLPGDDVDSDLFSIHDLLSKSIAPVAGTIFMLALLLSGTSAGIVVTIAGQMVSEGQLRWTIKPWMRRLITRSISITPSIIIAGAVGREGLSAALQASQVCLSVILPFVSAPLIYFTCRSKIMSVWTEDRIVPPSTTNEKTDEANKNSMATMQTTELGNRLGSGVTGGFVIMRNNWMMALCAFVIWLIVVVMNVAMLVLVGMGKA
jgi:metal iron transporter